MTVKDVISEVIESKDMRDYLIQNIDDLSKYQIIDMIAGARIPLKRKYEIFSVLAKNEIIDETDDFKVSYSYKSGANLVSEMLNELNLNAGEIFILKEYGFDLDIMEEKLYGSAPYLSLEKAMEYIDEEYKYACEDSSEDEIKNFTYWYELEKYVPDENGNLNSPISFTIAPNGEIWFCDYCNSDYFGIGFEKSRDLNLPVPFNIGDIITIDCTPYAPIQRGLIIEKGDNRDCCCIQSVYITWDGKINVGALKHASVFTDKFFVGVSPLYRAEIYKGKLTEKETALKEISEFINGDEELGTALWYFVVYGDTCRYGISYELLKEKMTVNFKEELYKTNKSYREFTDKFVREE